MILLLLLVLIIINLLANSLISITNIT